MFAGFAKVWTPLLRTAAVGRKPVPVFLAGERLVVFRTPTGEFAVLPDRCPHRGAALSLGRVAADGCLECPFHGWRFDTAGSNRHVPLNPDAKLPLLGAHALPTRVIGDFLWVFTEPGAEAPPEPVVPDGLYDPNLSRTYVQRLWRCHWTRAMENMLDSPHLPFVHRRTIGRTMRQRMTPTSRMEITWQDTAWGGRSEARMDEEANGAFLEFYQPNIMALHIPIPNRHLRVHALVVPERAGMTRLIICQSRDFARWRVLDPVWYLMNARIAGEDRAIVESTGETEVPPAASEKSVATDRATLQFRKYYYEDLRDSAA